MLASVSSNVDAVRALLAKHVKVDKWDKVSSIITVYMAENFVNVLKDV